MARKALILAICCLFLATSAFGLRMRVGSQQAAIDANAANATNASVPTMKGTEAPKSGVYTYPNGTVIPPEELAKLLSSDSTTVLDKRRNETEKAEEEAEKTVEKAEEEAEKTVEKAEKAVEKAEEEAEKKAEEEAEKAEKKTEEEAEKAEKKTEEEAEKTVEKAEKAVEKAEEAAEKTVAKAEPIQVIQQQPVQTASPQYMSYPINLGGYNMLGSPFQMFGNQFQQQPMLNYGFQQPMLNYGFQQPMFNNGLQNYPFGGLQLRIQY